jgi:signal transduction histidine kinase
MDLDRFIERVREPVIVDAISTRCGWDRSLTRTFFQRVVREGVDNALLHGKGTFANVAMRMDEKNLTLVVCDNGVGIPEVMRRAFKESDAEQYKSLLRGSDVELIKFFTQPELIVDSRLIKHATQEGTTSRPERKGLGLYYLKSIVLNHGGELRIRSGKACVDFTPLDTTTEYDNMLESPGTMLRILTPLKT